MLARKSVSLRWSFLAAKMVVLDRWRRRHGVTARSGFAAKGAHTRYFLVFSKLDAPAAVWRGRAPSAQSVPSDAFAESRLFWR
jgi:hypothetical protein